MTFNEITAKPRFIFKPNPLDPNGYDIFQRSEREYEPVGSYIVLDREEPRDLTSKKLANLVGLMNGRKNTIDLSDDVDTRTLYHVKRKDKTTDPTHVVFRTYDGSGVSTENAIFRVEGGIFND